jgi:hypothetical protein
VSFSQCEQKITSFKGQDSTWAKITTPGAKLKKKHGSFESKID